MENMAEYNPAMRTETENNNPLIVHGMDAPGLRIAIVSTSLISSEQTMLFLPMINGVIKHIAEMMKLMAIQNGAWNKSGRWMQDCEEDLVNDLISI